MFMKQTICSTACSSRTMRAGIASANRGWSVSAVETLFELFVPALKMAGCSDEEVRSVLVTNPRLALSRRR